MGANAVKEISRMIAKKKRMEEEKKRNKIIAEKNFLWLKAVARKKTMEKSAAKRAQWMDIRYWDSLNGGLTLWLFLLFFASVVIVVKSLERSEKHVDGLSNSDKLIFNPYENDRKTRKQLSKVEKIILETIRTLSKEDLSVLKIKSPNAGYDILSICNLVNCSSATLEFVQDGIEPVPIVFKWDKNGKIIEIQGLKN